MTGPWAQEWFQDALLDLELRPMDKEWLEAVLSKNNEVQLVATIEDTGGPSPRKRAMRRELVPPR